MGIKTVLIELTSRQVDLLLEYSYPFDNEEEQLKNLQKERGEFHTLKSDDFYAPILIGDICHCAKKVDDEYLLEELDEIADIIEMAISSAAS